MRPSNPCLCQRALSHKAATELSDQEKVTMNKLQEFFFSVVVNLVPDSQESVFGCPVIAYTACFAYNEDNTWKPTSQVTLMLAHCLFLLRGTSLYYEKIESSKTGLPPDE